MLDSAPQAAAAAATAAWGQPGPYVIADTSTATAAAAVAATGGASGGGDVFVVLRGLGCERIQSFILLDVKWSLQAQVRAQLCMAYLS
jgi:hypothetical protein